MLRHITREPWSNCKPAQERPQDPSMHRHATQAPPSARERRGLLLRHRSSDAAAMNLSGSVSVAGCARHLDDGLQVRERGQVGELQRPWARALWRDEQARGVQLSRQPRRHGRVLRDHVPAAPRRRGAALGRRAARAWPCQACRRAPQGALGLHHCALRSRVPAVQERWSSQQSVQWSCGKPWQNSSSIEGTHAFRSCTCTDRRTALGKLRTVKGVGGGVCAHDEGTGVARGVYACPRSDLCHDWP